MPRAIPKKAPPPEPAPRRVEVSLLVLEHFRDPSGTEWRKGDRAPLARAAVREAALERPELFAVEFETETFDPDADWFRELAADYEQQYRQVKARRDGAEKRRQQALHAELDEQERGQPELERLFKAQERERKAREKALTEGRERRAIENEVEFEYTSGFHFQR